MVVLLTTTYVSLIMFATVWQQGSLAGPFGPVVDGPNGILPDTPIRLRQAKKFMSIPIIAGFNRDAGSYIAGNLTVKNATLL